MGITEEYDDRQLFDHEQERYEAMMLDESQAEEIKLEGYRLRGELWKTVMNHMSPLMEIYMKRGIIMPDDFYREAAKFVREQFSKVLDDLFGEEESGGYHD